MDTQYGFIDLKMEPLADEQVLQRSADFFNSVSKRRSVREFSTREVPYEVICNLIMSASSSPSGANKQPWTFCLVSNPELKKQIRAAAEAEEFESYQHRMSDQWLQDLKPIGTDWHKPFLESAPWLIVVFKRIYDVVDGEKWQNYYVNESVGIACGTLIQAIHHAGLATLTHTPSPMNFLTKLLQRPENERPYLLMPVGFAADNCKVPNLSRKGLNEVSKTYS